MVVSRKHMHNLGFCINMLCSNLRNREETIFYRGTSLCQSDLPAKQKKTSAALDPVVTLLVLQPQLSFEVSFHKRLILGRSISRNLLRFCWKRTKKEKTSKTSEFTIIPFCFLLNRCDRLKMTKSAQMNIFFLGLSLK